ncbi:FitA-like ribbon-helix-helix domain-containing protein [Dapis sp. BLCC M172]|uniref:FitA-like ribbon-helix-helix domain-containing protein n=1 Tax=Dapis sp. BLCC M172 TaxID=2975281 RepID=UPI003CF249A2
MANLTINDLPDELMAKIQQLANQNNCSLNQKVIVILKELLQDEKPKLLTSPIIRT